MSHVDPSVREEPFGQTNPLECMPDASRTGSSMERSLVAKAPVGSPAAMGNAIRRFESFPLRQLILETLASWGSGN